MCAHVFPWLASHVLFDQPVSSSSDDINVCKNTSRVIYCSLCSCHGPSPMMGSSHCVITGGHVSVFPNALWASLGQKPSLLHLSLLSPPGAKGVVSAHVPVCSACCWFIAVAASVLLRFLAFPVRSGLCRKSGQKAIWCASQSSSPVGSLVWVWCDNQVVQRPRLCSQAQLCLLSHAWLELVQGSLEPCLQSLLEISAPVS